MNANLYGCYGKSGLHSVGRITLDGSVCDYVNASVGSGIVKAGAINCGVWVVGLKNGVVLVVVFVGNIGITSIAACVAVVYVAVN